MKKNKKKIHRPYIKPVNPVPPGQRKNKYRKHPRVDEDKKLERDDLIPMIKEDLKKALNNYCLSLMKLGGSYVDAEDCVIKEVFSEVLKEEYRCDIVRKQDG